MVVLHGRCCSHWMTVGNSWGEPHARQRPWRGARDQSLPPDLGPLVAPDSVVLVVEPGSGGAPGDVGEETLRAGGLGGRFRRGAEPGPGRPDPGRAAPRHGR